MSYILVHFLADDIIRIYLHSTMLSLLYRILVSLAAFAVFSWSVQELSTYLSFKMQQDEIAARWCVNKNVENSSCHGSCMLMQKLKKDTQPEDAGDKVPRQLNEQHKLSECIVESDALRISIPNLVRTYTEIQIHFSTQWISEPIPHPPRVFRASL